MNEEEIINILENYDNEDNLSKIHKAIQDLLDLYNELKEKNASLQKEIKLMKSCDLAKVIEKQQNEIETWKETENDYEHELARKDEEIEEWQKAYVREINYWLKFRNKINKIANNDKDCSDNEVIKAVQELQEINVDLVKTRIEDLQELNRIQQEDFISKDKIREIIDICDNTHEQYVELPNGKVIDRNYCGYLIEYLKELLEEK